MGREEGNDNHQDTLTIWILMLSIDIKTKKTFQEIITCNVDMMTNQVEIFIVYFAQNIQTRSGICVT